MNHLSEEAKRIVDQTYSKPAPLNAETVTIGCEFEFILAEDTTDGSNSSRRAGLKAMYDALRQPCKMKCSDPKCPKKPKDKKSNEFTYTLPVVVESKDVSEYNNWQVGTDRSIERPGVEMDKLKTPKDMVAFHGIEIRSRVMQFSGEMKKAGESGEHVCWISLQKEIEHVCNVLGAKFGICREGSVGSKYHVFPTSRSGFHCHVGNGLGVPISFETAKRLFSIFAVCERHLDRLVGIRDITGSSLITQETRAALTGPFDMKHLIDSTTYNKPLSVYLTLGAHLRRQRDAARDAKVDLAKLESDHKIFTAFYPQKVESQLAFNALDNAKYGYDIDSWLAVVKNAHDIYEFRDLVFQKDKKCTLNLMHLPEHRVSSERRFKQDPAQAKLTIEFRQHAGTLLATEATSFIELVVGMVLRCHESGDKFHKLVEPEGGLRKASTEARDFIKWTECGKAAEQFYESHITGNDSALIQQLKLQEKFLKQHGDDMPMAEYALEEVREHLSSIDPQNVEGRITEKMECGGYGQFKPHVLQGLLKEVSSEASEETQERLTIGYRVPVNLKANNEDTTAMKSAGEGDSVEKPAMQFGSSVKVSKTGKLPKTSGAPKLVAASGTKGKDEGSSKPSGSKKVHD